MADVSCWSCGSDGNVQVFCPPQWNGEEYAGGGWISVPTPDSMGGTSCSDCRKRLRDRHCPDHYASYQSRRRLNQSPIGGSGMRSASGKRKCPCTGCERFLADGWRCAMCCDRPDGFGKSGMMSATGEKGICNTDNQLTLHSLSIGIGAVAGLYLIPNKFLGAVGGMVAGGVLGGLILNSACK
jgi:hypothetical protein